MELKKGYKQTEVGVIPEDWDAVPLGEVLRLQRGFDLPSRLRKNGKIPIVSSSGISDTHNEARVAAPGIVTGRYGTIGKVFYLEEEFWPLNTTLYVSSFKNNHPLYLSYLLTTVDFESHSGKSGVPGINRNDIHGLVVARPSVPEQRAIAQALSDVDALLSALDQLIAKKRDLKQGAMQRLLTGETRLPGFDGEWKIKKLSELAHIRSGGTPSTGEPKFWDGDILWCTPTDISALNGHKYLGQTNRLISEQGLKFSSAEMIPAYSVVMTSRATIGECAINKIPVSTNQGFKNFVPFARVDVDFLYYLLTTQKQKFINLCGGSTFLEIGKRELNDYEVEVPDGKAEQTAIAEVLSDMDAELAALMERRAKTRDLKQGMMQELLTGATRLL